MSTGLEHTARITAKLLACLHTGTPREPRNVGFQKLKRVLLMIGGPASIIVCLMNPNEYNMFYTTIRQSLFAIRLFLGSWRIATNMAVAIHLT